ncbi:MAG: efflux RND transporter periplasmic adaptor subunit [Comamonadaceae bacterium]|nr:efflux RND transporter periplasmic adaptor subunit [Comamonadaceae bacterium]
MTEQTRKIVLPAYLARRLEAFRIVGGNGGSSYLLRDKAAERSWDYDAWQFFVLEVLPGCESAEKLRSVFKDRFDRELGAAELHELFDSLLERQLLDESALQHPLLAPYAKAMAQSPAAPAAPAAPTDAPVAAESAPALGGQEVVTPALLAKRLQAWRAETADGPLYHLADELRDKSVELQPWQFFVLEVLPEHKTLQALVGAVRERYGLEPTTTEIDSLFASMADRKLFDAAALKHPLLEVYAKRSFEIVDGKAVPRKHSEKVAAGLPAPSAQVPKVDVKTLPAGVQDAPGLDPQATSRLWPLFDPRPVLGWLQPLLAPLRYLAYALPVLLAMALMLLWRHGPALAEDLRQQQMGISLLDHLVFALLTLNLGATVVTACVAHAYKAAVERVCLTLYVGFIPRFVNRIDGLERLSRRQMINLHGANLLFRFFMLSVAVLTWYNTRDVQGSLHEAALAMVLTAAASLVLETGNPLMKGSSYFVLSAFLNEPHLRGKAYKALRNKMGGGVYRQGDSSVMAIYALAFITWAFFLVSFVTFGLAHYLYGSLRLGGSAVLIAVALLVFLFWRNWVSLKKFGDAYERAVQFERWRKRTLIDKGAEEAEVRDAKRSHWGKIALACLAVALFVPYPYEPAGSFSVYPARKQVLSTDTPGIVEEVFFDGGETVRQGTVIARLAHADWSAQVKVFDAKIDEQKSVIADLKARPKPQEVALATQVLQLARTREAYSRGKVPRLEKLHAAGAVTFEELDAARKDHETDLMQVAEKQAALDLVKVGATREEVAAAEARLASLGEERAAWAAKVERATLKMPFDGNILTLHLKDRVNSFLDRGQPFVSVEDTGTVTAEVELAESDVQYARPGALVRVRPAAYFNHEFVGRVAQVDRNVTAKSFGNVVKVIVTVDNADGALKTGMTGEAKLAGPTMPLWQAFTQALARFFRVQLWSWIP